MTCYKTEINHKQVDAELHTSINQVSTQYYLLHQEQITEKIHPNSGRWARWWL